LDGRGRGEEEERAAPEANTVEAAGDTNTASEEKCATHREHSASAKRRKSSGELQPQQWSGMGRRNGRKKREERGDEEPGASDGTAGAHE